MSGSLVLLDRVHVYTVGGGRISLDLSEGKALQSAMDSFLELLSAL